MLMTAGRSTGKILVRAAASLGCAAVSTWALRQIGPTLPTSLSQALSWAALVATALAAVLAALRLASGPAATGRDADRAMDGIARAWLTTFLAIIVTVQGSHALIRWQDLQQQRL